VLRKEKIVRKIAIEQR